MGPSEDQRGPLRCYRKSGPTTKVWGALTNPTSKALPDEQRLPSTLTRIDLGRIPRWSVIEILSTYL